MPEEVLWDCAPKTKAKLEIVSHYLGAWFNILANKGYRHVVYIDGFCGPGEYKSGEEGSPVIAARLASATAQRYQNFKATLLLIDEDQKALGHLQSLSAIRRQHPNVEIDIKLGTFSEKLEEIVGDLKQHARSPTFSFVDPFGFGHSPLEKIRLLLHNEHSELFVNFWCGYMNRFKEHQNDDITSKIKAMVGTDELQNIIDASDSIDAFCESFEKQLKSIGRYTLKFMMRDEKNIRDNAFFFCGFNSKGFEKIKETMWKIDPEGGNSFSTHRASKEAGLQANLFEKAPQTARLSRMMIDKFRNKSVAVSDIFTWVIEETDVFLPTHARAELDNLLERSKISYNDPQDTGRRKRVGDWPGRLVVRFQSGL